MTEIEEWVYRDAAIKDPLPCGSTCAALWNAEHKPLPETPAAQELWDKLAALFLEKTHLWGSLTELRNALNEGGSFTLGASPIKIGWHIGNGEGSKWMELIGPKAPSESIGCGARAVLKLANEEVDKTTYSNPLAPGNEWYLIGCNNSAIVAEYANAENPLQPENKCNKNSFNFSLSGWAKQEWQWNLCGEGFYEGKEVWAPIYAEGFYKNFHFGRVDDWTGQKLEGEFTRNVQTVGASDPGRTATREAIEKVLEESPAGRSWIQWVVEGEKGAEPLGRKPGEEYGPANPSDPPKCFSGKPVNCATGNEVESQTDLTVGGRGPGLRMTRTYNSQLAAQQSAPGPFGYGWTGSYSDHVELSEEQKVATVYRDNGSTAGFFRSGEKWVSANPLVQATLVSEAGGYLYTLPDQTVLHFNTSGQLVSEVDRNGNTLTMNRSGEGRLESVSDPAGRKITFAYNSEGLLESATDPMGHVAKYSYEAGNLASVTLPGETAPNWRFKYDSQHRLTSRTDGRGGKTTNEYDSENRVISQTDAAERTLTFQYEPSRTRVTNKATGAVTDEHYSADNELVSITHGYGTASATTNEYTYNSAGNLASVTDGNGHTTKYEYDSEGNRIKMVTPEGHETKWSYDGKRDVLTVTQPSGEKTTITRDEHGNATVVSRPAPKETTQETKYEYNFHGQPTSMTDPLGRKWTYEYNGNGDRTSETDPESDKRTWGYNEDSQVISTVNPRGNVVGGSTPEFTTTITRDAQGRTVAVTEQSGKFHYGFQIGKVGSENGQLKEPTGEVVTASGNVDVVDRGNNRIEEFSSEGAYIGKFGSSGTEEGKFKSPYAIAIDSKGDLLVTDEGNNRVQKFNEKHEVILTFGSTGTAGGQFKEPKSIAVASNGDVYVSDAMNERIERFNEKGEFLATFGWGVSDGKSEFEICKTSCRGGLVGSGNGEFNALRGVAVGANGYVWADDAANNRVEKFNEKNEYVSQFGTKGTSNGQFKEPKGIAIDAAGHVVVADSLNNRVQEFTPSGGFLTTFGGTGAGSGQFAEPFGIAFGANGAIYIADIKNNRVEEWAPTTVVTEYKYDSDGNLEQVTDPNGHTTKFTYNADNERVKVEEPNKTIIETGYDGAGYVTSQTDGNKHTTKYVRNVLEQVTEIIDPLLHKTTKTYDLAGNLHTLVDAAGRTTTYTHNTDNQLTKIVYSDGITPTVEYEYNADGNRTKMIDGTGKTTYTHDQLDRLTKIEDGHGNTTGYEYDLANEQTKITYPNGKTVEHSYDKAGRLHSLTDWLEHTTSFAYDPGSNPTVITFPAGTNEQDTYSYNNAEQQTATKMTKGEEVLASLNYTRDSNNQVISTVAKGLPGTETTEDGYDENERLTKAGAASYEYDAANDPTKTPGSTNIFNAADELTEGTGVKYSYDEIGERTKTTPTSGPATTYGYNQASDLTSVARPEEGATPKIEDSYAYNGDGMRVSQTSAGKTSYLALDESEELPLVLNDGTNNYIYGPNGLPVEQINNEGKTLFLHHDQQGSTRMLTGTGGTVEGTMSFDPYGNTAGSTGTATTPLGYDAQYTSSDTGLIYLRARTYDPATAQFMSVDPWVAITGEPYSYVGDNPLTFSDPTGRCGFWCVTGIVAGGIALGTGIGEIAIGGSVVVGGIAVVAGAVAAGADTKECVSGSSAACIGAGLGIAATGGAGAVVSGAVTGTAAAGTTAIGLTTGGIGFLGDVAGALGSSGSSGSSSAGGCG
ncbi:MAG TPA: RHS repeat-associated core domain-containing protein [Solirubrobacteraceae bacterium]|jgi:RHS repeat-associated protein|nr:RHS repeat-associated core domain-containing protein [Solirubrobacteraceae bacterium]